MSHRLLSVGQYAAIQKMSRVGTVSEVLGCLYVLEGSTLGGRIIIGHLKAALPLNEGGFSSTFPGVLARHCEEYGDREAIVNSACETFASLERWFSPAAITT